MWSRFVMSQAKHNSFFLVGMAMGLWVSLAVIPLEEPAGVGCPSRGAAALEARAEGDEFEPQREEKPLGSGGQTAGRAVLRPRYYSTELGIRGSLLTGVLSSEEALRSRLPALNRTLAHLQPALKFFITASTMSAVPGLANVVGFTDTREMLKPFHALKYLADNYLEEYDFFFLVTDSAFVNARRVAELAARLSVSRDVHMGVPAGEHCELDSGVLLSNSVLRAVHNELEWCVRNSYSPRHDENLGRCVLHAAHAPCSAEAQGLRYEALRLEDGAAAPPAAALARAAAAGPVRAGADEARALAALHAGAARARLQALRARAARLRAGLRRGAARHPPGYRNGTWPAGLRRDPGLAAPAPDSRFAHLRWTLFNATHALMPDEVRAAARLAGGWREATRLAVRAACAWARRRWGARAELLEGAWQWEPAAALRFRLVLRLAGEGGAALRAVEVVRALGAARLVPVPYVTESARLWAVLPAAAPQAELDEFLARFERVALLQDKNVNLYVVQSGGAGANSSLATALAAMRARHPGAVLELLEGAAEGEPPAAGRPARLAAAGRAALLAAEARAPPDALLLLMPPHLDFNQEFLNRVRMNTIPGRQWFLPVPFARHAQYAHPRFTAAGGGKPQQHTGRFAPAPRAPLLAVHAADLRAARDAHRAAAGDPADVEPYALLAAAPLHCVRAPEPAAVLAPLGPPCEAAAGAACRRALAAEGFERLDLGARTALAQLLLEMQSEQAR